MPPDSPGICATRTHNSSWIRHDFFDHSSKLWETKQLKTSDTSVFYCSKMNLAKYLSRPPFCIHFADLKGIVISFTKAFEKIFQLAPGIRLRSLQEARNHILKGTGSCENVSWEFLKGFTSEISRIHDWILMILYGNRAKKSMFCYR